MENPSYYELSNRRCLGTTGVFKIKSLGEDKIIFSAPNNQAIISMPLSLNTLNKVIKIQDKPLAIDVLNINQEHFIIIGCYSGKIVIVPYDSPQNKWWFLPNSEENFVNDIVSYNTEVFLNCYNNGNVAIWGTISGNRLHTFHQMHENYTYKLRINKFANSLISCGNDCQVIQTDLQKLQHLNKLSHSQPIWCAQHINGAHTIGTIGLESRLAIWDTRFHNNKVVQTCNLDGNQSSILVPVNTHLLYFGRNQFLKQWDRRMNRPEQLSAQIMLRSIESMHLYQGGIIACGRGSDISNFQSSTQLRQFQMDEQYSKTSHLLINEQPDIWPIENMDIEDDDEFQVNPMSSSSQQSLSEHESEGKQQLIDAQINQNQPQSLSQQQEQQVYIIEEENKLGNQKEQNSEKKEQKDVNSTPTYNQFSEYLSRKSNKISEQITLKQFYIRERAWMIKSERYQLEDKLLASKLMEQKKIKYQSQYQLNKSSIDLLIDEEGSQGQHFRYDQQKNEPEINQENVLSSSLKQQSNDIEE